MIQVPGVLHIRVVTGRHGDFRVGRLATDLGEFAVKDAELDQYDEGRYEGRFGISQISPSYYSAGGRLVVEVRARLNSIALVSESEPDPELESIMDQDPVDETQSSSNDAPMETATDDSGGTETHVDDIADGSDDKALFGLLWPLGDTVKLDPTVGRMLFRKQRDRLKELGYHFQAINQQWTLS